ncbi:TIGR01621 family pseudouridine synthase [Zobellella maritima]|uniref:TIGR01621 family pseudouridine synthase n=1 Tax=Zobellella maritima TaxID=2059725 RepID=UPI000E302024|nr:TIGR01621 family pseudouridine synthase [Zobellella maritima]
MTQILLAHPDFYAVNKAAGIGMHQEGPEAGLVRVLGEQLGETLYPVHRLDKMTTGVLLLARNPEANRVLSRQFAERTIGKTYLALSDRRPAKKQGWVKGDMEKARRGSWKLTRTQHNPAVSRFYSHALDQGLRAFVILPRTGKTHQIRVALKSIGCPILGDVRYGGTPADRGYLHAWRLDFHYGGEDFHLQASLEEGALFVKHGEAMTMWAASLAP